MAIFMWLSKSQTVKSEEDLLDLYFCDLFRNHDIVYTYLATC